jgi:hypothetical protein
MTVEQAKLVVALVGETAVSMQRGPQQTSGYFEQGACCMHRRIVQVLVQVQVQAPVPVHSTGHLYRYLYVPKLLWATACTKGAGVARALRTENAEL